MLTGKLVLEHTDNTQQLLHQPGIRELPVRKCMHSSWQERVKRGREFPWSLCPTRSTWWIVIAAIRTHCLRSAASVDLWTWLTTCLLPLLNCEPGLLLVCCSVDLWTWLTSCPLLLLTREPGLLFVCCFFDLWTCLFYLSTAFVDLRTWLATSSVDV